MNSEEQGCLHSRSCVIALQAGIYLMTNVASATCIVFANKTLFTHFDFHFVYALTLVHVITTLAGMHLFAAMGLYERKKLPITPLLSLATAFVGYIVFWNISLQVQPSLQHHVMLAGQYLAIDSESVKRLISTTTVTEVMHAAADAGEHSRILPAVQDLHHPSCDGIRCVCLQKAPHRDGDRGGRAAVHRCDPGNRVRQGCGNQHCGVDSGCGCHLLHCCLPGKPEYAQSFS